jgi:hypothetical protein
LFEVRVSVGSCAFFGVRSIVVGLGEVGSMGHRKIGIVQVGLRAVGWIVRLDCSPSLFYFALSGMTKLAEVVLPNSTMLECWSGNLSRERFSM